MMDELTYDAVERRRGMSGGSRVGRLGKVAMIRSGIIF